MGLAGALQEMHARRPPTRRALRVRSHQRLEAVDRLLGRLEIALPDRKERLEADAWEELQRLSLDLNVRLPRGVRPRVGLGRLHTLLLDWQEDVMNHEFPQRLTFIDAADGTPSKPDHSSP